jgi:hypothetical protein
VTSEERKRDWPQRHRDTEIGASREPEEKDNAYFEARGKEAQRALRFAEKMKKRIPPHRAQRARRRNGRQARTDSQKSLSYGRRR